MKSATTKFLRKLGAGANYAKAGDSSFVYGASPIDIVCHIASFFEAVAFMQTDIFRLRVIEAVAMAMVAIYALLHTLIMYWIATSYGHRFTSAFTATIYIIFWLSTFR